MLQRLLRLGTATSLGLGFLVTLAIPSSAGPAQFPTATPFNGLPTVGALFGGPSDTGFHFCTASVVDSPGRNLILIAAHCIQGTGRGLVFVPKYHQGVAPYGIWSVKAAYVDKRWLANQNPQADYAFLTMQPQQRQGHVVNIEDVVGGNRLVIDRGFHNWTVVVGYPAGVGGRPIICANETYDHNGYPAFNCHGYVGGTSGGPFLVNFNPSTQTGSVDGVIGGLHQGGCFEYTSYSSYFTVGTALVYYRAVHGGPGDMVPKAGSDGC